ncbi:TVP38/TMEM64 family protein [Algihabitans albus]|uniref:TVP38/TMEM64 family protein n=1 Tax=Algihabitans albus TaxID=2164067 RepID=UPI000E5C9BB5|nr:TVP38/TMEM64 family protein [Algihabitans albus]
MTQIDGNIKNDDTPQESKDAEVVDRSGGPAWLRWLPLAVLFGVGATAWFVFDLGRYLSFEALAENRGWLLDQVERYELRTVAVFIFAYALATAFSIPGGAVLTVLGGFLFGTLLGTVYVVTGATLGSVAVFLAARTALGDSLRKRVGGTLKRMEAGFREHALSYLLVLRLIPIFPFWLVNLVPAFLGVPLRTYVIGTLLGIVPGTFVYASLGNGVGALFDQGETPDIGIIFSPDILTPILGLAVLALLPVAYKTWKARRAAAS